MGHEATLDGRTLGARGAAAAPRTPAEQAGRPTARAPARGVHGDSVRAPDGHAVAVSPAGDALRQRIDLLAALQTLDPPRGMATTPSRLAPAPGVGRRDRLEPSVARPFECGGERGGDILGANPTDKGKAGCKRHLVVDAQGIPLALHLTGANVHDSMEFERLLDAIPALRRRGPGRPRHRPTKLHADKGYDYAKCRRACRRCNIQSRIARRGIESKTRLGRHRWVVERTFSWWNRQRRLPIRYDRTAAHYEGFLYLASALICWSYLMRF